MFNDIIVGVDDRDGGCDAIALARRLTVCDHLVLAHVVAGHPYKDRESIAEYATGERTRSLEEFERERALALLDRIEDQAGLRDHGGGSRCDA